MAWATRLLLIAATVLAGLLAGVDFDRAFVAMPAWEKVGAVPWAEFSRRADLGNGLLLYPIEAIGSTLFALATAACSRLDPRHVRRAALPLYAAALFAVAGLALTVIAAPIMLGIRDVTDAATLDRALHGFRFWGN